MQPRGRAWSLTAACLATACSGLTGRAPVDAPRDASAGPVGYDAAACTGGSLPRVDGLVDQYVPAGAAPPYGASSPRALALDDRGGAYLAGACVGCGAPTRAAVWRVIAASGQPDGAWAAGGTAVVGEEAYDTEWWSVAVDPAGRVVAGGYAAVAGAVWPSVARFTLEGAPDLSFGDRGRAPIEPSRFGPTLTNGYVLRVLADADGILAVGTDEPPTDRPATRALVARLRVADGALDPTFGAAGVLLRDDLRGCFDARRDGDGYVLGCASTGQRPALLRLDGRGAPRAWAAGAEVAEHALAPRGFHLRTIERDSAGRWLAVGGVLNAYSDAQATPAVVRFSARGEPDPAYGVGGAALLHGVRQSVRYAYASASAMSCADRLLVGANLGPRPLVAVLDREGARLDPAGERGFLSLPTPAGATAAAVGGIAWAPGPARAVVLTNFLPGAFSLQSLSQ